MGEGRCELKEQILEPSRVTYLLVWNGQNTLAKSYTEGTESLLQEVAYS